MRSVNTLLCIDLKTSLRGRGYLMPGKDYIGVLRRDVASMEYGLEADHYTFVEMLPRLSTDGKRNPHVFEGEYITVTRRDDGTYRPNFKPMRTRPGFSVDGYALAVCNELRQALKGLVEEG